MVNRIQWDRRRFLGTAAVAAAAAGLPQIGSTHANQAAPIKPGTSPTLGSLKQVHAGLLNVGYADVGKGPVIAVPTITLEGDANGAPHAHPSSYAKRFVGKYTHRDIKGGIGHNLPQEAPHAFAQAVVEADGY